MKELTTDEMLELVKHHAAASNDASGVVANMKLILVPNLDVIADHLKFALDHAEAGLEWIEEVRRQLRPGDS